MSVSRASSNIKEASVSAVVIRADGTREDLGVISFYSRNPLKMLLWALRHRKH